MFWKVMKHWQTTIFCIGWLSDMLHLSKAVCLFSVCILSIFEYVPKKVFSCRRSTTKDVLFVVGKLHLHQRTLSVFSSFGIIIDTLVCRIDVHARLLILRKNSSLHGLILVCAFIVFEKKIPLHVYFPAFLLLFALHVY